MPLAAAPAAHSSLHFTPFVSMGGGTSSRAALRSLEWIDGTLSRYHRGGNTITELGPFFASSVTSLSISHKGRGLFPDDSDYYAIGKGDSIKSPDGHRRMGCSRKCG